MYIFGHQLIHWSNKEVICNQGISRGSSWIEQRIVKWDVDSISPHTQFGPPNFDDKDVRLKEMQSFCVIFVPILCQRSNTRTLILIFSRANLAQAIVTIALKNGNSYCNSSGSRPTHIYLVILRIKKIVLIGVYWIRNT
jgi:hypothetical protein